MSKPEIEQLATELLLFLEADIRSQLAPQIEVDTRWELALRKVLEVWRRGIIEILEMNALTIPANEPLTVAQLVDQLNNLRKD